MSKVGTLVPQRLFLSGTEHALTVGECFHHAANRAPRRATSTRLTPIVCISLQLCYFTNAATNNILFKPLLQIYKGTSGTSVLVCSSRRYM